MRKKATISDTTGDRLLRFIQFKKITNKELEEKSGIARHSVAQIKQRGQKGLRSDTIEAILKAFPELSADWFLGRGGPMITSVRQKKQADNRVITDTKTILTKIVVQLQNIVERLDSV